MSASWRSSFSVLPVPHTTPVSANSKSLRRPIHNPYDKFTKPEFDEWIGGITSALRRALGEETDQDVAHDEHQSQDAYAAAEETFQDQSFEDSFADIQSRRAKGKGKDPREGPGLGAPQNPIELLSDSESGSEAESVQSEEDNDDYAEQEGEGFDVRVERRDPYDRAGHWTLHGCTFPIDPNIEEDEGDEISSREVSPEIIEIDSDGEGNTGASIHAVGYGGTQHDRSPQPSHRVEDEQGLVGVTMGEEESQLDVEDEDFPSTAQRQLSPHVDLPDPWQGPRTFAEDFYAGGDFSEQDMLDGVSPSSLTPAHDAHLHAYFPHTVQDDRSPPRISKEELVAIKVTDDALPDSSPPPSSPNEKCCSHHRVDDYELSDVRGTHGELDDILDQLYRDAESTPQEESQVTFKSSFDEFHSDSSATSTSQTYAQHIEHLDWNRPPAFPRGKLASRAGHIESSLSKTGSGVFEEARHEDVEAEHHSDDDEDGSDEISQGPIPLGTSDLVYDADVDQVVQREHSDDREELDEADEIRVSDDSRFPLLEEPRLSADECATMESFFELLDSREMSPTAVDRAESILASFNGVVADLIGDNVESPQIIDEAGDKYLFSLPSEALEAGDGQSHPLAESFTSIEQISAPTAEIQDQLEDVTSENVGESPLPSTPTFAAGAPILTGEQLDGPDAQLGYIIVEMEATTPASRGVSEGIEIVSFAGETPDLDGDYVVEEPPTAEASAEPEDGLDIQVDALVETVPVTPKFASVGLSSSDIHNTSPFPMPIFGDPSASDPLVSSEAKRPPQISPRLVSLPGTPHIILSPHPTPGLPTPVSVSVSTSMLHAFSGRVSPSEDSGGPSDPSGLFTPREDESTSLSRGDASDEHSLPHSGPPPLLADDVLASVSTALAEESQAGNDTPMADDSDDLTVAEQSPTEFLTGDHQDTTSELVEDSQQGVFSPLPTDHDGNNENQLPSVEPDAGHHSVGNSVPTSPKSEEVQQAVSTTQTAVDERSSSGDDHLEEASVLAEASPATTTALAHSSPSHSCLNDQDPFQPVVHNDQVPPETIAKDNNQEDTVSQSALERFSNASGRARESSVDDGHEPSRDFDDQESQTKPSKRKRVSEPSSRLTRSMSDKISAKSKISKGGRRAEQGVPARKQKRKLLSFKDSGSDAGSVSSSASTAVKMPQFSSVDGSRASSVVSTSPSDSSSIRLPIIPPPIFHAHGALHHHRHEPPAPPPISVQTQVHTKTSSPEPSQRHDGRKDLPSASAATRSPSQHSIVLTSSPVTRSNCRFHKISLPKEEGGPRVCFVVPGCSLGDKELMDEQEILDHGPATHEDYSRLVGNIEALDFNPYLVGILRQLVGVDLIRENEVFYLLQPGEEAHYKKKGRKSIAGSKLASSTIARSSPTSPQVSVASRRSPVISISRPPISSAGSMVTSYESSLSEAHSYRHSSLFSASGEELSDEEGSASPKSKRRRREPAETLVDEEGGNIARDSSMKAPRVSSRILKRSRSKRQVADSAAYKPRSGDEGDSNDGADGLDKGRRKVKKTKGKKRPRVADEEQNTQPKRQKQK